MKGKLALKEQIEASDKIINKVADFYGLTNKEIRGKCRKRPLVKARFIAMYFLRQKTDFTLKTIGDMFGRDHTSVIHALNTIRQVQSLHYETDLMEDLKKIQDFI